MRDFDLNVVPNSDVSTGEYVDMQPLNENIAEIPKKRSVPHPRRGKTRKLRKKAGRRKRVSPAVRYTKKKPACLPDGWVVDVRVRRSGQLSGDIYKHYKEPGTGKTFRSLISVKRHLGMLI